MVKSPFPWQDSTRFPGLRKSHSRGGVSMALPAAVAASRNEVRTVAPKLIELTETLVYPDIWERPGLSKRDRSLITLAALTALYRPDQAEGSHRARARPRRDEGGDRRAHHPPGVLRGLAQRDVRREGRQTGLRGEEVMKVGFIGLGTMGASMASNLQAGGHELQVSDVRKEVAAPQLNAGAVWEGSPR